MYTSILHSVSQRLRIKERGGLACDVSNSSKLERMKLLFEERTVMTLLLTNIAQMIVINLSTV